MPFSISVNDINALCRVPAFEFDQHWPEQFVVGQAMRAASANVRTKDGALPSSDAQRSQSRSSGSVLAEFVTGDMPHRGF